MTDSVENKIIALLKEIDWLALGHVMGRAARDPAIDEHTKTRVSKNRKLLHEISWNLADVKEKGQTP